MNEHSFQTTLLKNLRAGGVFVQNMEVRTQPGFPDILVVSKTRFLLVELKVTDHGPRSRLKTILSRYQLPWWLDYLNETGATNLFLCARFAKNDFRLLRISTRIIEAIAAGLQIGDAPWRIFDSYRTLTEGLLHELPTP